MVRRRWVLAVGSSVAEGWVDPHGGGYLKRAFAGLSSADHVPYELINKSAAGDTVRKISTQYLSWLRTEHPTVVVLSWGALDDLHNGTPRFCTAKPRPPARFRAGMCTSLTCLPK